MKRRTHVPYCRANPPLLRGPHLLHLAYDLEGTELCAWLNSIGVNCALAQYRVPIEKYFPDDTRDIEDAQQALRITRSHATVWHLDPHRVGVLGVFLPMLLVRSLRKRTGHTTQTVIAFLLAIAAGYLIRLDFVTTGS